VSNVNVGVDRISQLVDAALRQPGARERASGIIKFMCPACRDEGHDAHADNAGLFTHNGTWGCAFAKDTPDGRRHWDAIGRALGAFERDGHTGALVPKAPQPTTAHVPASEPLRVPEAGIIGIARDFAELYAQYLESPLAFFYFVFLAYFGALIAKKVTLDSELRPEPRLFVVLIGESADTRKSTALKTTNGFFRSLGTGFDPPTLYGVGSAEGIAAELKENPDLLLQFDEFKAFVDKAKNEHSVALPMVTTLFETGDYDNRVKAERVSVRGASLSMVAACTSDTYATMFDQRFFAIGLLNRLWLVADRATSRIPVPRMIPEAELEPLRERVRRRLQNIDDAYAANGMRPVVYRLTPAAFARFRDWYETRSGSIFDRRLDTYGHRLMVLLAATTGKSAIDEEIMGAVLALLHYQLDARRECDPVDAENTIAGLEEKIRRALAREGAGSQAPALISALRPLGVEHRRRELDHCRRNGARPEG
jgi:hypothetical protein